MANTHKQTENNICFSGEGLETIHRFQIKIIQQTFPVPGQNRNWNGSQGNYIQIPTNFIMKADVLQL